jgi:hypothetical protein
VVAGWEEIKINFCIMTETSKCTIPDAWVINGTVTRLQAGRMRNLGSFP